MMPEPSTYVDREAVRRRILGAIEAPRRIPRPGLGARLRIVATSAILLGVVVVYALLVAGAAAALAWHAYFHIEWLQRPTEIRVMLPLYAGGLLLGALVLTFLLKPLVARPVRARSESSVSPEDEPFLHDFVAALCRATGAPRPQRIFVTTEAGAAAGFVSGERMLRLGLPLIRGLPLDAFVATLAHELAHLSQRTGLRASYLSRRVDRWLTRVIDERDVWDAWIDAAIESDSFPRAMIATTARGIAHSVRGLIAGLRAVARTMTAANSRAQERVADRWAVELAGSEAVIAALCETPCLMTSRQQAIRALPALAARSCLFEDLTAVTIAMRRTLPDEDVDRIALERAVEPAHPLATHPLTRDRIAAARRAATAGSLPNDVPADVLLDDPDSLGRATTEEFYRSRYPDLSSDDRVLRAPAPDISDGRAPNVTRFCGVEPRPTMPLPLGSAVPRTTTNWRSTATRLRELRSALGRDISQTARSFAVLHAARRQRRRAGIVAALELARIPVDPEDFELPADSAPDLCRAADRTTVETVDSLRTWSARVGERLELALGLVEDPDLADRIEDLDQHRSTVATLWPAARALGGALGAIADAKDRASVLGGAMRRAVSAGERRRLAAGLRQLELDLLTRLEDVRARLGDVSLSMAIEDAGAPGDARTRRIAQWAMPRKPPQRDPLRLARYATNALDKLTSLHRTCLASLIGAAEAAERAVGLDSPP